MDWNKSNTILIIAFVILNIFLITTVFSDVFTRSSSTVIDNNEFVENVENLLEIKNIKINAKIPDEEYFLPVLEIDYEIIKINNELVQKYLGKGVEAYDDIFLYSNENNETLEIINNKKLLYRAREKSDNLINKNNIDEFIEKEINKFLENKQISKAGFHKAYEFISNEDIHIIYTQKYNDVNIDNSYMCFNIDNEGIYSFEMQRANSIIETVNKIKTIKAAEALPRLLTYDVKDKEIIGIHMTYFSSEDSNWQNIHKINSDPTWIVELNDGSRIHLPGLD